MGIDSLFKEELHPKNFALYSKAFRILYWATEFQ